MRRITHLALTVFVASVFFSNLIEARERPAMDKLQSGTRSESIRSTQEFMSQIWQLEPKVQEKLLRARFTNAKQVFRCDDVLKSDKATGYSTECSLTTGKDLWSLSSAVYLRGRDKDYHKIDLCFNLTVNIAPNAQMLEWMRARDEYTEYSKEKIEDSYATLDISGMIESFTWEKKPTDYFRGEPIYDPLTYVLTMRLGAYSTQTLTLTGSDRWTGTDSMERKRIWGLLLVHINSLKEKTAEWVKFYMGKSEKPEPILNWK